MTVRIAVVDSGCTPAQALQVRDAVALVLEDRAVRQAPATADALGHGGRVAGILLDCAPQAELLVVQVFRERLTTTAAQVRTVVEGRLHHGEGYVVQLVARKRA